MRPLSLRGREQAPAVGKALAEAKFHPSAIYVSSAVRTLQTWKCLSRAVACDSDMAQVSEALYEATVADVVDLIHTVPSSARCLLVVGHEPTMAATAAYFAGPQSKTSALAQVRVGLPTAGWAVLDSGSPWEAWDRASARLEAVSRTRL